MSGAPSGDDRGQVFGDARFERLAALSNGHLYNLRGSATYRAKRTVWTRTRPTTVEIALRQAPEPDGKPGHVRVDTLHAWTPSTSGDRDGVKGLFLINLVDPNRSRSAVTQYELVGAAAAISERFLLPLLEGLLLSFPFRILGFHADNASRRDAPAPSTSTTASRSCSTSCASRSPLTRRRRPSHSPRLPFPDAGPPPLTASEGRSTIPDIAIWTPDTGRFTNRSVSPSLSLGNGSTSPAYYDGWRRTPDVLTGSRNPKETR